MQWWFCIHLKTRRLALQYNQYKYYISFLQRSSWGTRRQGRTEPLGCSFTFKSWLWRVRRQGHTALVHTYEQVHTVITLWLRSKNSVLWLLFCECSAIYISKLIVSIKSIPTTDNSQWPICFIWFLRDYNSQDTVECRYNAVWYCEILHEYLQEMHQNVNQTLDPQKTPHTSP